MLKNIIVGTLCVLSLLGNPTKGAAEVPPKIKTPADYINEIFGAKAKIATAVFKHESGMKLDAVNYNCNYGGHSTFCKKGDEKKAISTDCGLAQINVKGRGCPKELLTLDGNMKMVAVIYKQQGLNAWVSFSSNRYKKLL